jgi:chemotaxis protein methyltransferase CheR
MRATGAAASRDTREFPLRSEDFEYLTSLIYQRSGIVLGSQKENMLYSRLARRLRELRLRSFGDYCRLIRSDRGADEIHLLVNAVTTNLTRFFRENHHFEHLSQVVIGGVVAKASALKNPRLRIWSAGCSSGEEPYSIALTVSERIPNLACWDARILATDLDSSMVAKAKLGTYSGTAIEQVPKGLRTRYFQPDRDRRERWMVTDAVRALITFKQLNLLATWPMKGPFDVIFCRNVMIYFNAATKATLVRRFAELLKPQGWLYVGHSESLLDERASFRLQGRTIYQKIS